MMEGVSLSVVRDKPAYRSDVFYPWEKLRHFPLSFDTYTWEAAAKLPSITLEPGKRFEQRLSLEDAYRFDQPGNYAVTFSTVVSILVGDKETSNASPVNSRRLLVLPSLHRRQRCSSRLVLW